MPSAKDRETFLAQDRARIYLLSTGENESTARLRANQLFRDGDDEEDGSGTFGDNDDGDFQNDDVKDNGEEVEDLYRNEVEPVNLPQSTHTLFFTQPVRSIPFGFALLIVVISIMCLSMAFTDNLGIGLNFLNFSGLPPGNKFSVPVNVSLPVRIAQYLGIFIALLMEEEIPTGAYLLRMIPSSSFKKKFPNRSYKRFVASAMLRIILGYIFLLNVLLILVKANGVLDIFYDVLALQFISELDDIAFSLSKLDILGRSLRRACTAKLFQTEFERQKFARSIKASIFLKTVYFVNIAIFLGLMIHISLNQRKGTYQCNRIKVDFGDAVWGDALVRSPEGGYNEVTLSFSTFNGVYEKVGRKHDRPVYQEMKKFDYRNKFDDLVIPAEIKYSDELHAWTFNHPDIVKKTTQDESEPWLLRSPDTEEYDLLNVASEWNIWFGVIDTTHVTYSCTECNSNTDCNLNGNCVNGECECLVETVEEGGGGISYLGPHCEVKLKDKCGTIFDGSLNSTWSIIRYTLPGGPENVLFEEYNRPVYGLVSGIETKEDDIHWLVYVSPRACEQNNCCPH